MGVRLPTILGKAIDDVVKTLNDEYEEERITDLTKCIERMEDLMEELQGNEKLRPIIDDGEADVPLWNKEIARYFRGKDFMTFVDSLCRPTCSPDNCIQRDVALRRGLQVQTVSSPQ